MKKLLLLITGLLLLFSVEGQILRYSNYTAPTPPVSVDSASWEPEYKAVYYAMTTPPSIDTADYQNRMVRRLVDSSLFSRIDLMYVFATSHNGDGEAYINWITPGTFDATVGAATVNFSSYEGVSSDGSTGGYLTTGYNPSTNADNIGLDDLTIGAYTITSDHLASVVFGVSDGTQMIFMMPITTGPIMRVRLCNYINLDANITEGGGLAVGTRRGNTDSELYQNGSSIGTGSSESDNLPNQIMYLCANNNNGSVGGPSRNVLSIAFLMDGITDEEAATLFDIIEEYMDAIGSGVVE